MSMQIERRISVLENRTNPGHQFDAIVVHFVRPGPDGPIDVEAVGYASMTDVNQRWMHEDGETIEHTLERATREANAGLLPGAIPSLRAICADE